MFQIVCSVNAGINRVLRSQYRVLGISPLEGFSDKKSVLLSFDEFPEGLLLKDCGKNYFVVNAKVFQSQGIGQQFLT